MGVLIPLFFIAGRYLGGYIFLDRLGMDYALEWETFPTLEPLLRVGGKRYLETLIMGWLAQAGLPLIPVLIAGMYVAVSLGDKQALHGDARFARPHELRPYMYKGDYQ